MALPTGHAKGINFRTFWASLERLYGPEVVEQTKALLPEEIADAVRTGAIVASGFYPVAWYIEHHKAAMNATRRGPALAREIAAESTRADFRGVYRFFAIILSPESFVARAGKAWGMYWSTGTVTVVEARRGYAHVVFEGCEGFDAILWQDIQGSIEALLDIGGAKNVRMQTLSGGRDEDNLDLEMAWE